MNNITIIDPKYKEWIKELSLRYRKSQIKAAVKVNSEMIAFYWTVGRDIVSLQAESKWGSKFLENLSADLRKEMPNVESFSPTNLLYMKNFYLLYTSITPQLEEQLNGGNEISPQVVDEIDSEMFSVPWGHYRLLIDKFKEQPQKAMFYIHKIASEGWSRDMLLNFISTDLYEREGKSPSNFTNTLPEPMSDLAQELTLSRESGRYNTNYSRGGRCNNITRDRQPR